MISVVIPALNEEGAIADTVEKACEVLTCAGLEPFEVVVVDDGSTDRTGEIARSAGAHVVRHPHNVGYGQSIKDGIVAARYETIVICDADGTYPIEAIPNLVRRHREGFDMTVGARTGPNYRESALKVPLRWLLRHLVEYTASRKIPDINSGLRVFERSTVLGYFSHLCDTFSFTTSLTLAYIMTGRFVTYVPIDYHPRIGRSKVMLFRDAIRTFQYILEAAVYFNPLRIFFLATALCLGGAFACFIAALLTHLPRLIRRIFACDSMDGDEPAELA
jgi:glycosyltransferase involved in cell wall biosynthesis